MAIKNYTVGLNDVCWDIIKTALEVYSAFYMDEFLKDPGYLEICAKCGFQDHEEKIIAAINCEIESQMANGSEIVPITLLLQQWQLVTHIMNDFYESVAGCAEQNDEEIVAESKITIDLGIEPEDLENYLDALEEILDELELITDGAPVSAALN
ncbi:MAG: hypothetical protein NTX00_04745 [Candidatus Parcubacteria bacterium]|nr:hypothetical protein [Candidatus Parcubacteria bacterium]